MSHPSPQSSTPIGPMSSPYTATDPTLYSPDADRKSGMGHRRQLTAIAAGKQPVKNNEDKPVNTKFILPAPAVHSDGIFPNELSEDDNGFASRYMFITSYPDGTNTGFEQDRELFNVQHQMKLVSDFPSGTLDSVNLLQYACFANAVPFYSYGVFIRYDDIRDAAEGKDIFEQHEFTVDYVTIYDFAKAKAQDIASLNYYEGQIKLAVLIDPLPDQPAFNFSSADLAYVINVVRLTAQAFGDVRTVTHVETSNEKMHLVFRIEFASIDASVRAANSLHLDPVWGVNTEVCFLSYAIPVEACSPLLRRHSSGARSSLNSGEKSLMSHHPTTTSVALMPMVASTAIALLRCPSSTLNVTSSPIVIPTMRTTVSAVSAS